MQELTIDILAKVTGGADEGGPRSERVQGAADRRAAAGETGAHATDRNGQQVPRGYPGRPF